MLWHQYLEGHTDPQSVEQTFDWVELPVLWDCFFRCLDDRLDRFTNAGMISSRSENRPWKPVCPCIIRHNSWVHPMSVDSWLREKYFAWNHFVHGTHDVLSHRISCTDLFEILLKTRKLSRGLVFFGMLHRNWQLNKYAYRSMFCSRCNDQVHIICAGVLIMSSASFRGWRFFTMTVSAVVCDCRLYRF